MDITVQELKQKLAAGETFIFIDVREQYEYDEYNLGARLIPLGEFAVRGAEELDGHQDDEIIVHCRSGARSAMAQQILMGHGFTNVRNLIGGALAMMNDKGGDIVLRT